MSKFNSGNWFAERKKYNFKTVDIEGIDFELMPLTEELIQKVLLCDTYVEMIAMAARCGLSSGRNRVCDDVEMASDIDVIWEKEELNIDCDPSLKHKVGEKVCAISGLTEVTEDKKLDEEIKAEELSIIDGDNLPDMTTELGNLDPEQMAQHHKENAAA